MDNRIENAILEAKKERRLDFWAEVRINEHRIEIDTRITRDPNRAANGGEYSFWETIWQNEYGETLMQSACTCEFWQPESEPEILPITLHEAWMEVLRLAELHDIPVHVEV